MKKWLLNNGLLVFTLLVAIISFTRRASNNELIIYQNKANIERLDKIKLDKDFFNRQFELKDEQRKSEKTDVDHRFESIGTQLGDLKSAVKELRIGQREILKALRSK